MDEVRARFIRHDFEQGNDLDVERCVDNMKRTTRDSPTAVDVKIYINASLTSSYGS